MQSPAYSRATAKRRSSKRFCLIICATGAVVAALWIHHVFVKPTMDQQVAPSFSIKTYEHRPEDEAQTGNVFDVAGMIQSEVAPSPDALSWLEAPAGAVEVSVRAVRDEAVVGKYTCPGSIEDALDHYHARLSKKGFALSGEHDGRSSSISRLYSGESGQLILEVAPRDENSNIDITLTVLKPIR